MALHLWTSEQDAPAGQEPIFWLPMLTLAATVMAALIVGYVGLRMIDLAVYVWAQVTR